MPSVQNRVPAPGDATITTMGTLQRPSVPTSRADEQANIDSRQRRFAGYLWRVLLIPALLYPVAFLIVLLPSYERWSTSQYGPMLEYPFNSRANADVVIFGDSSAFLGIDPRVVDAQLGAAGGVHTAVLPDTVGSLPVTGDAPLRSYLAHNRAPKLIVLYFSPWNLDFGHMAPARLFEGEEMMLRHMRFREIAAFAWHHPTELPEFPFRLFSTFGPKIVRAALQHVNREASTADARGHADFAEHFPPLDDQCVLPQALLDQQNDVSVRELAARYRTTETSVLVYLAPLPRCGNSAQLNGRSFADLSAAPPTLLPADFFAGDRYYAHIRPPFVEQSSMLFAKVLQKYLRGNDLRSVR